ncbi:MAG: dipeptidase [Pseudomonadaceae bacterium]|nr:dipeptidase [Pseudomonadaceae bacterium]
MRACNGKGLLTAAAIATVLLALGCAQDVTTVAGANGAAPETSLMERARNVHAEALVLDAHADIVPPGTVSSYVGPDGLSKVEPAKMRAGGVDAVVMSIAVGPGPRDADGYADAKATALTKLAAVRELTDNPNDDVVLARSADEIVAAHKAGQRALILGFQNARILGEDVTQLNDYFDAGARVFALTHLGHNDFADSSRPVYIGELGAHEPDAEHDGLSDLGVAAIKRVNALGGVVDISQLSRQAALQVIELSSAPVIASHSNIQALSNVNRNLSDEELDAIAANDGVVHIAAFKGYLIDLSDPKLDADIRAVRRRVGIAEDYDYPFELYWELDSVAEQRAFVAEVSALLGPATVARMVDHIDYAVQRMGIDHVGIGNDFNHGSGIVGFQDASEALNVTAELLRRDYSAGDIEKIWGGNFLRVLRAAEAAAEYRR